MPVQDDGGSFSIEQASKPAVQQRTRLATVDRKATYETVTLYQNLKRLSKTNCLFGHQDDTKTGYGWANEYNEADPSAALIINSDVQKITGAFPAVYGWDFMNIANFYTGAKMEYEEKVLRQLTIEAYNRGGVNTYSWHYHNPVAKEGIWWRDAQVEAVQHILPGGSHHEIYKGSLKEVADFARSLIGSDGKMVPVIFRPFHEMNGDWFWWGKTHCTVQEYKSLYQFTVTYLRDSLNVHNFLYAWSPDRDFTTESQYLEYYPGDAYVDIVGMDNYYDLSTGQDPAIAGQKLKIVSDYAIRKNKVAAFTETGLHNLPQSDWFSSMLLPALRKYSAEVAYVMLWSNTTDMYWTPPYNGHAAESDFISFCQSPYILSNSETPLMYQSQ
jgi:mannan endo-1,4-beta-mannosidase